jgi:hypothetical protein
MSSDDDRPPSQEWIDEDRKWKKFSVGKYVYFRWSTACNSKNRFKGVVVDHWSKRSQSVRTDYLVIKTFGFSEDTYVMGKDIREIFVLPNKTTLMSTNGDEDIRKIAVRRWHDRDGWSQDRSQVTASKGTPNMEIEPGLMSGSTTGGNNSPVGDVKISLGRSLGGVKKHKRIATPQPTPSGNCQIMTTLSDCVFARHSKRSLIGRRLHNKFAFANDIY